MNQFPIIAFDKLYHVGSLNQADKRSGSHEGAGLSVTTVPYAWAQIAGLSGGLHQLARENNQFLNFHELNKEQLEEIKTWGKRNDYIEDVLIYRVSWYDGEMEETCWMDFLDKNKAMLEAESEEDRELSEAEGVSSTAKMKERAMNSEINESMVIDLLATIYAEEALAIDGVWWEDILDVYSYSAPRGVICAKKLREWQIKELEEEYDPEYN